VRSDALLLSTRMMGGRAEGKGTGSVHSSTRMSRDEVSILYMQCL
jgi:hypothetical protein